MSCTIVTCDQRSPEWFAARVGRLTASAAGDMLATVRSGEAAARRNLRTKLLLERLTGKVLDSGFTTRAMQQGVEREPLARAAYEALTGDLVVEVGFVQLDGVMAGCSPDGVFLDKDGRIVRGLELKAPEPTAHLDYYLTRTLPAHYRAQIVHSLWVTGASRWEWMSHNPDFPEAMQTVMLGVDRDEDEVAAYAEKALAFLAEVDDNERVVRERITK